jgi:hypothetical protein
MKKATRQAIGDLDNASFHLSSAATLIEQASPYVSKRDRESLRHIQLGATGHAAFLTRVSILTKWAHRNKRLKAKIKAQVNEAFKEFKAFKKREGK